MKKKTKKPVPHSIMEFLKENFREGCLTDISRIDQRTGSYYKVDVADHDFLHHLKFSAKGRLLEREMEPAYPLDPYDGEEYWEGNI